MTAARLLSAHSHFNEEGARVWEPALLRPVHRQRARQLRRRGVEVIDTGLRTATGRKVSAWFVACDATTVQQ